MYMYNIVYVSLYKYTNTQTGSTNKSTHFPRILQVISFQRFPTPSRCNVRYCLTQKSQAIISLGVAFASTQILEVAFWPPTPMYFW